MCATSTDARADVAFAEVQANAGEDVDRAAKAKAQIVIVRAFLGIRKLPHRTKACGVGFRVLIRTNQSICRDLGYLDRRHTRHASQAERG
jgi:hypothetical protein